MTRRVRPGFMWVRTCPNVFATVDRPNQQGANQ